MLSSSPLVDLQGGVEEPEPVLVGGDADLQEGVEEPELVTTLLSAISLPKLSSIILVVFKDDYFRIQIFLPGKYHLEPQMFISLPLYRQVPHVKTPLTAIFLKLYSSISVVLKTTVYVLPITFPGN